MNLTMVFLALGVLFLVIGVVMLRSSKKMAREGLAAEGVIVGVDVDRSGGGENQVTSYMPIFEFTGADGVKHTVRSGSGSNNSKAFVVGKVVPVLYLPAKPEKARINTAALMWVGPIVFCAVGGLFTMIGIVASLKH